MSVFIFLKSHRHPNHWWYRIVPVFYYLYFKEVLLWVKGRKLARTLQPVDGAWHRHCGIVGEAKVFISFPYYLLRCGISEKSLNFPKPKFLIYEVRNEEIYVRGLLWELNVRCLSYNSWHSIGFILSPFPFLAFWYEAHFLSLKVVGFYFSVLPLPHKAGKECEYSVFYCTL